MESQKTIRTEGSGEDYFLQKLSAFCEKERAFVYLGHLHQNLESIQYRVIDSAGYNRYYYDISDPEGTIRVLADCHIGHPDVFLNFNNLILPRLYDKGIKKYIFLGDTFELALSEDTDILIQHGFWEWLSWAQKEKIEVIFIIGNHDINLDTAQNKIRQRILGFYGVNITAQYKYKNMIFIHGHSFDKWVVRYGKWYGIAFRLFDYFGSGSRWLWQKSLKRFFVN